MPPLNKPMGQEGQETASAIEAALLTKVLRLFFSKFDFHPGGVLDLRYYTKEEIAALLENYALLSSAAFTGNVSIGGDLTVTGSIGGSWAALPLNTAASWADYGSYWGVAQYKKAGDIVRLRGLVKRTAGADAVIGTLPSGARPSAHEIFPVTTSSGLGEITIAPSTGEMTLRSGSVTYVSLAAISFSTA